MLVSPGKWDEVSNPARCTLREEVSHCKIRVLSRLDQREQKSFDRMNV
jgi:hypothetical protein